MFLCNMLQLFKAPAQTGFERIQEMRIRDWPTQQNQPSKAELKRLGKERHLILSNR